MLSPTMDGATIVLRKQHFAVAGSLLGVVALGVAVLAYVALRGSVAARPSGTATPMATNLAPVIAAPPVATATIPATTDAVAPPPSGTPKPATAEVSNTTKPAGGVGTPVTAAPTTTTAAGTAALDASAAGRGANAAAKPGAVPTRTFTPSTFDVKALVGTGSKASERDAQLVLSETKVTVTDNNHEVLNSVPYESVASISYSTGRDPLWNSPQGPAPVARGGGGFMGIRGDRFWVALRTRESREPNIVLRFNNPAQARNGLKALEERTNRKPETVIERKDAK
jgi:hypothetical protein